MKNTPQFKASLFADLKDIDRNTAASVLWKRRQWLTIRRHQSRRVYVFSHPILFDMATIVVQK